MANTAHTLNCLMCGAPSRSDATACAHCGARLATVACPSCFGMIFQGSRFCPLCGVRADRAEVSPSALPCPHCETCLTNVLIGAAPLHECSKCQGLWVDVESFERICQDREEQASILGTAEIAAPVNSVTFKYVRCPHCRQIMHRVNFAGSSGVIVDVCKKHGTWFDAKELQHIIRFIRAGGMDRAREKEKQKLEAARRQLNADRAAAAAEEARRRPDFDYTPFDPYEGIVAAAGSILWRIFRGH